MRAIPVALCLVASSGTGACALGYRQRGVEHYVERLAGKKAVDCGRVSRQRFQARAPPRDSPNPLHAVLPS